MKKRKILWLIPSIAFIILFYIFPLVNTIILSFINTEEGSFTGFENYISIISDKKNIFAIFNNLTWLVSFLPIIIIISLFISIIIYNSKYSVLIKTVLILPISISSVTCGIIWKLIYSYQPKGSPQVGTLNFILSLINREYIPHAWLYETPLNNFAIMVIGVWIWTGLCVVIFFLGLNNIPKDYIDSASIEGANNINIVFKILIPLLKKEILAVSIFLFIYIFNLFDLIYITTGGKLNTEVIAMRMYKEMFMGYNFGRASVLAVFIFVMIFPIFLVKFLNLWKR